MKSNNINVESIAVSLQSRRNYSLLFIDKIQSICEAGRFFMKALLKRLVMYWPVTEYRKICIMKLHTRISREWENFLIMEKKIKTMKKLLGSLEYAESENVFRAMKMAWSPCSTGVLSWTSYCIQSSCVEVGSYFKSQSLDVSIELSLKSLSLSIQWCLMAWRCLGLPTCVCLGVRLQHPLVESLSVLGGRHT